MKTLHGALRMLGNAKLRGELITYSVIQIGEETLTNIHINRKLDNFLQAGLQTTEDTRLWMVAGGIVAVQVGSGQRYYSKVSPAFVVSSLVCLGLVGAMLSIHAGLGLVFGLCVAWFQWRPLYQYMTRIPAGGGVKV